MSKHTPITMQTRWMDGKGWTWKVIEDRHFGRYLCALADLPSLTGEWTARDIRVAIDRMIAAAPELLEALTEMTELAAGPVGGVSQQQKRDVLAKARAAITKATGESA